MEATMLTTVKMQTRISQKLENAGTGASFLFQLQCCKSGVRLSDSVFTPIQSESALAPYSNFNSPPLSVYATVALHSSTLWSHNIHMTFYGNTIKEVDHWT